MIRWLWKGQTLHRLLAKVDQMNAAVQWGKFRKVWQTQAASYSYIHKLPQESCWYSIFSPREIVSFRRYACADFVDGRVRISHPRVIPHPTSWPRRLDHFRGDLSRLSLRAGDGERDMDIDDDGEREREGERPQRRSYGEGERRERCGGGGDADLCGESERSRR